MQTCNFSHNYNDSYDPYGPEWNIGLLMGTDTADSLLDDIRWRVLVIVIYIIIILMGFLGNFLIILVIVRNKHLQTVTNVFIANLAFSDIGLCVFNLPFQLYTNITNYWIFGEILCQLIVPTYGVPLYVSSLTMLVIAIDRYLLIVYPFKNHLTNRSAMFVIAFIAILALAPAVPVMVFTKLDRMNIEECGIKLSISHCRESWDSYSSRKIYSIMLFCTQFFIPLLTTSALYAKIYRVLKNRPMKKSETKRNHRTNKILISIVVLFTLCWLPWNIFSLILELAPNLVKGGSFTIIDMLLKGFALSSTCVNPFLYGWLNGNFRKEFEKMFGKIRRKPKENGYSFAQSTRVDVPIDTTFALEDDNQEVTAV